MASIFLRRCIKAAFLLGCVFLLLNIAQAESIIKMPKQIQKEQRPGEKTENSLETPYAQAYYDFLQEYISSYEAAAECEYEFSLLFIDDDEIPELLISLGNDSDIIGTKVYSLYSYCEKQVISLGEYGYDIFGGMLYSEKSGIVIEQFSGKWSDDGDHLFFYRIGGGKSEEICHLHYGWVTGEDGKDTRFFQIDGISVQRDAFMAKWNELSNNHIDIFHAKTYSLKETELLDTFTQAMARISLSLETEHMLWKRDSEPALEQVSRQAEALAAYETVLDELAQKWSDTGRFTLIYLDDDDIPELAFIEGYAHISPVNIYTYDQGEAVYVGYYGSEAITAYWEKKGIIFNWFMSGSGVFGVHQVSGTEDTSLQVFNWEWEYLKETGDTKICYVDGLEVPEEYYDEEMQKWRDNAAEKVLDLDTCTPIKDVDIGEALKKELQTLILTQYDTLKRNLLIKAGVEEDAILFMDYDDYDGDGIYEAFAFCGESKEEVTYYSGDYWFVGVDQCTRLPNRHGVGYRKIDGLMKLGFYEQKYLYYYSDYCATANISGIWTVKNGKPVEVHLPQSGQVVYRGDRWRFELWVDSYNNYYEPEGDFWSGHTWRPYFYHYCLETKQLEPDERDSLSPEELEKICGFDLAGEVAAEGYEVTAIVKWKQSDIVTINYTIPPDEEDPFHTITYENIIWDCQAKDYWRSKERGVSSWRNAGEGGSI